MDTALLKLYSEVNSPELVTLIASESACDIKDSVDTLKKYERFHPLGLLFKFHGEHDKALHIWTRYVNTTIYHLEFNPPNAEATFFQSIRMQSFWKILIILSCWYSLDSSPRVLSDEYPCARISIIFQCFLHHFVLAKLATSSIRVNPCMLLSPSWVCDLDQCYYRK